MGKIRLAKMAALAAPLLLLAASAAAQTLPAIKFPGGEAWETAPGQFAVVEDGVIRWTVVFDNRAGTDDILLDYVDVMDPGGSRACDAMPPCQGAEFLDLLCSGADAPDPGATGTVFTCDPATGRLEIRGIQVPAATSNCIEFSARATRGVASSLGFVSNVGCFQILSPLPGGAGRTSPVVSSAPACSPPPVSLLDRTCSRVNVLALAPPQFSATKTVAFDDANADGILDMGERLTWTVSVRNDSTTPEQAWIFDTIPPGTTFVDITADPDGTCSLVGSRIECPSVTFPVGATKVLEFRTDLACTAATDDDSFTICNEALVCTDATATSCVPSDDDTTPPLRPTCIGFTFSDLGESTKTSSFQDFDLNGVLSSGDRLTWTITARNRGRRDARDVVVTDVLDASCLDLSSLDAGTGTFDSGTNTITWNVGALPVRSRADVSFSAFAQAPAGTECCNQAQVQSGERADCAMPAILTDDPATGIVHDPSCVTFGPHAEVSLTKDTTISNDVNGNGYVDVGDEVEFVVTLVNTGTSAATAVRLDDPLATCFSGFDPTAVLVAGGGGGTNASLAESPPFDAGQVIVTDIGGLDGLAASGAESVSVTFRATFDGDPGIGCCNRAEASYAESRRASLSDDPRTADPIDTTCTNLLTGRPVLLIDESATDFDGDGCAEPGEDVTYTIRVTVRDGDAGNVQLTDALLDPARIVEVVNPGTGSYDFVQDLITWDLGVLYDDEYVSVQWIGRLACFDGAMPIDDIATATAINGPPASASHALQADAPVLVVSKTASYADTDADGLLSPGEIVSFVITVTDASQCGASDAVVIDDLDPDLDWPAAVASGGATQDANGRLTWTLPALNGLEMAVLTVDVPALDPASNGRPGSDGLVLNAAVASHGAAWGCERFSSAVSDPLLIGVPDRTLDLQRTAADEDGDGCIEPGERVTWTLAATPHGGSIDRLRIVEAIDDPAAILLPVDSGMGTYDPGTQEIAWDLGFVAAEATVTVTWTALVACDAPNGQAFSLLATAAGFPASATAQSAFAGQVSAAVLAVTKVASFADANGDGEPDPGESVTWTIRVFNVGACKSDPVTVADTLDADADPGRVTSPDAPQDDGAGNLVFDASGTPSLLSIPAGEDRTLSVTAPILDPATNGNPAHDGTLDDTATATMASAFGCASPPASGSALPLVIGRGRDLRLLRNDRVGCRTTAFTTMRAFLQQRPMPQECSEPTAIDPADLSTTVIVGAVSPHVFAGDADPSVTREACPQDPAGAARVLVFYEVDEPPPACLTTLRVARSGTDVVVSW